MKTPSTITRRSRAPVKTVQPSWKPGSSPALKGGSPAQFLQVPRVVSPASTMASSHSGSNCSSRTSSPRQSSFDFTFFTTWSKPPANRQGHAQLAAFDSKRLEELEEGKNDFSISRYLKQTKKTIRKDFDFKRSNVSTIEPSRQARKENKKRKHNFGIKELEKLGADAEKTNLNLSQLQIALAYCKALKGNLPISGIQRRKEIEQKLTARLQRPIPKVDLDRIDFEAMKPVSYPVDGFYNGESERFRSAIHEAIVTTRSLQRISVKPKDRPVFFTNEPFEAMRVQHDFTEAAVPENWEMSRLSRERQLFFAPPPPRSKEFKQLEEPERKRREEVEKQERNKKIGQFLDWDIPQRVEELRQTLLPTIKDEKEKEIAHLLARLHHERIFASQLGKQAIESPLLQKRVGEIQQSIQTVMKGFLVQRPSVFDDKRDAELLESFNRKQEQNPEKVQRQIAKRVRQSSVKVTTQADMNKHVQWLNRKNRLAGWHRWTHEMLQHKKRKAFNAGQVNDLDKGELIGYYGSPKNSKFGIYFDIDTAQEALKQRGWPFKKTYHPAQGVYIAGTDMYQAPSPHKVAPYRYYNQQLNFVACDVLISQTLHPETMAILNQQIHQQPVNALKGDYLPYAQHISHEKGDSLNAGENAFRFLQKVSAFAPELRQHIPENDAWAFSHLENVADRVINKKGQECGSAFANGGRTDHAKDVVHKAIGVVPNIPLTSSWRSTVLWKSHPQKLTWEEQETILAQGADKKMLDVVKTMLRPAEAPF